MSCEDIYNTVLLFLVLKCDMVSALTFYANSGFILIYHGLLIEWVDSGPKNCSVSEC